MVCNNTMLSSVRNIVHINPSLKKALCKLRAQGITKGPSLLGFKMS